LEQKFLRALRIKDKKSPELLLETISFEKVLTKENANIHFTD